MHDAGRSTRALVEAGGAETLRLHRSGGAEVPTADRDGSLDSFEEADGRMSAPMNPKGFFHLEFPP